MSSRVSSHDLTASDTPCESQWKSSLGQFCDRLHDAWSLTDTSTPCVQDASFIAQALVETGLAKEPQNQKSIDGLLDWMDKAQIRKDRQCPPWPFSSSDH